MHAVHQRQRLGPDYVCHGQLAVEVREEGIAARHFPFQCFSKGVRLKCHKEQTILACEMFGHSLGHLLSRGNVDIAIGDVNRGTCGFALATQDLPFVCAENFKYKHR